MKVSVYQSELNKEIEMELYGRLRYIGKTCGILTLTNNKIYDCVGIDNELLRIVDDEGEDYLYPIKNPKPLDEFEYKGGKWELVECFNDELLEALNKYA